MRNTVVYDGVNLANYDVWISGSGVSDAPARNAETIKVPGRNGALIVDNGNFENITVKYPAFIRNDFRENFSAVKSLMLRSAGYRRLEDSFRPDEYRMARYDGGIEADPSQHLKSGRFDLVFDCKPQRFLKSGEISIVLSSPGALYNSGFEALPLITVYGSGAGTVTVGGVTVTIKSLNEYVTLDCDVQDAYKGLTNANSTIYAPEFPTLPPGECPISWSGGVTRLEITPRWWTL